MAAANYVVLEKGATFRRSWSWKDGAGALINLTGYTVRMQIRDSQNSALIAALTTENGGIVLGGAAGTIAFYMSVIATAFMRTQKRSKVEPVAVP